MKRIVFFVMLALGLQVHGQSFKTAFESNFISFDFYNVEDGLPENSPRFFVEDKFGYLWMGTQNGLVKYDGSTFQTFIYKIDDSNSIANNEIYSIEIDSSKTNLIIGHEKGISLYNITKNEFRNYYYKKENGIEIKAVSGVMINDSLFQIILIKNIEVGIFNINTGEMVELGPTQTFPQKTNDNSIVYIFENVLFSYNAITKEHLEIKLDEGLEIYDINTFENEVHLISSKGILVFKDLVLRSSLEASKGMTFEGASFIRGRSVPTIVYSSDDATSTFFEYSSTEYVHLFTSSIMYDGFYYCNEEFLLYANKYSQNEHKVFTMYNFKSGEIKEAFSNLEKDISSNITAIMDSKNNIWIGIVNTGLFRLDLNNQKLKYLYNSNASDGIYFPINYDSIMNCINYVSEDGKIWNVNYSDNNVRLLGALPDDIDLKTSSVSSRGNNCYIGTNKGIYYFNSFTYEISKIVSNQDSLGVLNLHTVASFEDSKGDLWLAQREAGVTRLRKTLKSTLHDYGTYEFEQYYAKQKDESIFSDGRVMAMFEYNSEMYFGIQNQTGYFWKYDDEATSKFVKVSINTEQSLIKIAFANDTVIWIGSFTGGISKYDLKNKELIYSWNTAKGNLPTDWIAKMVLSVDGNLLFKGEKDGWYEINGENYSVNVFKDLEITNTNWSNFSSVKINNDVAIPGKNKIPILKPLVENKLLKMDIRISKLSVNNERIYPSNITLEKAIEETTEIRLDYSQNFIKLNFYDANFNNQKETSLFYRLSSYDLDWIGFDINSNIDYKNLAPGNYHLLIGVFDNDSGEKVNEFKFEINISSPWWETSIAYVGGILLIVALLFSLFRWRIRSLKKTEKKLQFKVISATKEIRSQKDEIVEQHKEIKDSIAYAKRIQSAILPPIKIVKEYLKDSFILYKPKDVVAGDFYWMKQVGNKVLFAAADCTGHGVPGAMVSVVCNNALNRSVREYSLSDPGEILDKTREIVIQEFDKSEEVVNDGMDIALCCLEGNFLSYAGANNPLWVIRDGEILETKANKQPIGKFDNLAPYTTHKTELKKNDSIYIFSDGYPDQFGGVKGKKYKSANFKKLLLSIQKHSMIKQLEMLDKEFENWKGIIEQIDDVCVIGVRI